jgi:hypothetical protein
MATEYKVRSHSSFEIIPRRKTFVLKETRYLESINVIDGVEHVVDCERGPPHYHGAYQSYDQAEQAMHAARHGFTDQMQGMGGAINEDATVVHYTDANGRKGSMSLRDMRAGKPPQFEEPS